MRLTLNGASWCAFGLLSINTRHTYHKSDIITLVQGDEITHLVCAGCGCEIDVAPALRRGLGGNMSVVDSVGIIELDREQTVFMMRSSSYYRTGLHDDACRCLSLIRRRPRLRL